MPAKAKKTKKTVKAKTPAVKKENKVKKTEIKSPAIEVTVEKKVLGEVPEMYHFFLKDGRKLKSLHELINAFDEMSDEVFHYHVNEEKNDFANWINDVMDEKKLASEIKNAEDMVQTQLKLLKHAVKELVK